MHLQPIYGCDSPPWEWHGNQPIGWKEFIYNKKRGSGDQNNFLEKCSMESLITNNFLEDSKITKVVVILTTHDFANQTNLMEEVVSNSSL